MSKRQDEEQFYLGTEKRGAVIVRFAWDLPCSDHAGLISDASADEETDVQEWYDNESVCCFAKKMQPTRLCNSVQPPPKVEREWADFGSFAFPKRFCSSEFRVAKYIIDTALFYCILGPRSLFRYLKESTVRIAVAL